MISEIIVKHSFFSLLFLSLLIGLMLHGWWESKNRTLRQTAEEEK